MQNRKRKSKESLADNFDSLEFGSEPGIIAKLSFAYFAPIEILGKTTNCRDERCTALFARFRIGARCIIRAALGGGQTVP